MDLTSSHIHTRINTALDRTASHKSIMRVNPAILCVFLMACSAMCIPIKKCRCVKLAKAVNVLLIADVNEYKPLPYCENTEVIVLLKNGKERCLDPELDTTKRLLEIVKNQKARAALGLTSTTSTTTTTSSTITSSDSTPLQTNTPTPS